MIGDIVCASGDYVSLFAEIREDGENLSDAAVHLEHGDVCTIIAETVVTSFPLKNKNVVAFLLSARGCGYFWREKLSNNFSVLVSSSEETVSETRPEL